MGLFSFWNREPKEGKPDIPEPKPEPASEVPPEAMEQAPLQAAEAAPEGIAPVESMPGVQDMSPEVVEAQAELAAEGLSPIGTDYLETGLEIPIPPEEQSPREELVVPAEPETQPELSAQEWVMTTTHEHMGKGYTSSIEYLWAELARIDHLVRAQTIRWEKTIAASKPTDLWGMLHVTHDEVDAYKKSQFVPPSHLPTSLEQALEEEWEKAAEQDKVIRARLQATADQDRLRLHRLVELFALSDLQRDLILVCLLAEMDARYRRLYSYFMDDASRTQPTVDLALQILEPELRAQASSSASAPTSRKEPAAAGRHALDPHGALLANSILILGGETRGDEALLMRTLRLDDRIADFLLGSDAIDGRLAGIAWLGGEVKWSELFLAKDRRAHLKSLVRWISRVCTGQHEPIRHHKLPVLFMHGLYGSGRLKAAQAVCTVLGLPRLVVSVPAALSSPLGWERIVSLACREARLQDAALIWAGCEALLERGPERQNELNAARWEHLMAATESFPGLVMFLGGAPWDPVLRFRNRHFLNVEFPFPSFALRSKIWELYLRKTPEFAASRRECLELSRELANDFQFTEGQVQDALATALGEARYRNALKPALTPLDLYEGCRRQSVRSLVSFARRVEPRSELTFDDLVLPPPNRLQLEELSERIKQRSEVYSTLRYERRLSLGKGLVALFTGTSGTGKTMAAELLANRNKVDLYKVDLSAVTSKWVGEAEKNLARVFAEAESTNAILFFDEADALFGKRGEVKEAQDRWANMEVNFLLQRMEEYSGVVILASNLRQNIDEAFLRRIQWMCDFPFPDSDARFRIYKRMFPKTVLPPSDSQLHTLADRFRLTGGSIKNVVVDATFRALTEYGLTEDPQKLEKLVADAVFRGWKIDDPDDRPRLRIHASHLVLAIAREYQKLGMPINRGEFGETYYCYVDQKLLNPG